MMFGPKNSAAAYQASVKKLTAAEIDYRAAVDALFAAKNKHMAQEVPSLRRKAAEAEERVKEHLSAAHQHWRQYWFGQLESLEPRLQEAAAIMDKYDAICRIAGGFGATPAASHLQALRTTPRRYDFADSEVPVEEPDSAVLDDMCGIWRN